MGAKWEITGPLTGKGGGALDRKVGPLPFAVVGWDGPHGSRGPLRIILLL